MFWKVYIFFLFPASFTLLTDAVNCILFLFFDNNFWLSRELAWAAIEEVEFVFRWKSLKSVPVKAALNLDITS